MTHPARTAAQTLFSQASAVLAGGLRVKAVEAWAAIHAAEQVTELTPEETVLLGVLRGFLRCGDAHPQRNQMKTILNASVQLVARQEKQAPPQYTAGAKHLAERGLS